MALMIVAHPTATFSGVSRVGDIFLTFIAGYTGPTELSSSQQTVLTNAGFAVGATPPQTPPDPFPQYLTDAETAAALANPASVIGAAGRAAFGTVVGTAAAPITDASTPRPAGAASVYWICATGVTPTNAANSDLIWNA